jgi:hypothetical protein
LALAAGSITAIPSSADVAWVDHRTALLSIEETLRPVQGGMPARRTQRQSWRRRPAEPDPYGCVVASDLTVPPLGAWPIALRVALLALLAWCMFIGSSSIADASGIGAVGPIALAVWAGLAAYAWGHGRLALLAAVVPVYYAVAFLVADQLDAPCSLRPTGPAIDARAEVVKWWPPHPVCEFKMADGSREYLGGFPRMLLAPFLWACVASVLALVRRPYVAVRAGAIVATWIAAVFVSFY